MKKIVIVDIDGTISIVGDRVKYLQSIPPNWDEFYKRCGEDKPNNPIIELVSILEMYYEIVYFSGRRESCREDTRKWMDANGVVYGRMFLRENGDKRDDVQVKPEFFAKAFITQETVAFIIEDRSSMVKKWRELGFTCLQVADGNF